MEFSTSFRLNLRFSGTYFSCLESILERIIYCTLHGIWEVKAGLLHLRSRKLQSIEENVSSGTTFRFMGLE